MDYSVAIVGGGPAGAVAALRLAKTGARVLVVDRERPRRVEAAEILSPEGREVLEQEQLWNRIPLDFSLPCTAMAAAWAGPEPAWTSFDTHPLGWAWHIDRMRLDAWLLRQLERAEVRVMRGTVDGAGRVEAGPDGGWQVAVTTAGVSHTVTARCLVLATGRAPHTIRLARRDPIDTLCLVAGTTAADPVSPDALIVEATSDGWWYSAPLVNGQLFTGWMTDFALVRDGRYEEVAAASLRDAPLHARRAGGMLDTRPPGAGGLTNRIGSATWSLSPAAGPGWIAIGDAALARDPIGGDGLTSALQSASHGAEIVIRALAGDATAWSEAATHLAEVASRYRQQRLALYRVAAPRWPASPFWRRFN